MKHLKILALFLAFSFVFAVIGIAQQQTEETVVCAVGGKEMKKSEVKETYEYNGKTYYFCCSNCKKKFIENPEKYTQKKSEMKEVYTCPMHPDVMSDKPGKCPKCGMKLEKKMMQKEHMHKEMTEKMHKEGEEKACCDKEGLCCPLMGLKDVEVKIENLKDGVVIKVTSSNAEVVKKMQEMATKMKSMCSQQEGCCKEEAKKEHVKK